MDLHEGEVDVEVAMAAAHVLVRERAQRGAIAIDYAVEGGLPLLWADQRKLTQMLVNLRSNAIKFTVAGGRVLVRARVGPGSRLLLSVADTGIGMTASDVARAMEPFGQVDSALNRKYEGTGLGLPLVKLLADLHEAGLAIDSAPGQGTTVTLQFPADRTILRRLAERRTA
jgi:two-component system cell cycle sensor histidine kinase PleC